MKVKITFIQMLKDRGDIQGPTLHSTYYLNIKDDQDRTLTTEQFDTEQECRDFALRFKETYRHGIFTYTL